MDLDELVQKYNRNVRAAGLLRYMLEADHGLTEEPEQKTWILVRQSKYQEFQASKRHKAWCGVSHSKGVHSKVSLCEPPLLWSTFCGRWCLTPYTPSIWV